MLICYHYNGRRIKRYIACKPFLKYDTIVTSSEKPSSSSISSRSTRAGLVSPATETAASHLRRYTAEVYTPSKGCVGCVSCASKDADNIALLSVFVNCYEPWYFPFVSAQIDL